VRCSHPTLDGAEGMLRCLTTHCHFFRVLVETCLYSLEHGLVLPSGDPSFLAGGAAMLDGAALARVGPVTVQEQAIFLVRVVVGEPFTGRTNVSVLFSQVAEVLLAKAPGRL